MGSISQSRAQSSPLPSTQNDNMREESPQICSITLEVLEPNHTTTTSCGHQFDSDALNRWLRESATCPLCREEIPPASVPTSLQARNVYVCRRPAFFGVMGAPELFFE